MTATLPPLVEDRIRHRIESGRYASVDEALDAAVRSLDELTPALWDEIERDSDEAERQGLPLDPTTCP